MKKKITPEQNTAASACCQVYFIVKTTVKAKNALSPIPGASAIAISLWPMIVPYHYTLWQAASSPSTQAFLLIGTLFLLPIIMYTAWSYWVFRGKVHATAGYH